MRSAPVVEVSADGKDQNGPSPGDRGGIAKVVDESSAFLLIGAEREDFLELVHDDDQPLSGGRIGQCK